MVLVNFMGNIIAPVFSGIILILFGSYFFISKSLTTKASRYFVIYLLSFGIFLILRPAQLFFGGGLLPLYINNFRSFIFLAICAPALSLSNISFIVPVKKRYIIYLLIVGFILAATYIIFNNLSSNGSYIAFNLAGLIAHEPFIPSMTAPFYGREVTIAIFIVVGIQFAGSGLFLLKQHYKKETNKRKFYMEHVLFGIGSVTLGLSFILGVLLKYWWIYYSVSVFSSILAGSGIMVDIKEMKNKISKTIPYIKEELTNLIRFQPKRTSELYEIFNILGINTRINTFIIMECKRSSSQKDSINLVDMLFHEVEPLLLSEIGENCYFLIPIGRYKIGICIYYKFSSHGRKYESNELCKKIIALFDNDKTLKISFGIGRTRNDASGLSESYHEAVTAQAYASYFKKTQIIHINDVQDSTVQNSGVLFDLNDISISIKTGNTETALAQFNLYFAGIIQVTNEDLVNIRMRSFHLVSTILQDAMSVGISGINIAKKSNSYFMDLLHIEKIEAVRNYLIKIIEEITNAVAITQKNKSSKVVINSKKYVDENYANKISGKLVSEVMGISYSYLHNIFKKETGISLNDYINSSRIKSAKQLLTDSSNNITEVAYAVGFNDSNYFSTVFKKSEGMSPNKYRKSLNP